MRARERMPGESVCAHALHAADGWPPFTTLLLSTCGHWQPLSRMCLCALRSQRLSTLLVHGTANICKGASWQRCPRLPPHPPPPAGAPVLPIQTQIAGSPHLSATHAKTKLLSACLAGTWPLAINVFSSCWRQIPVCCPPSTQLLWRKASRRRRCPCGSWTLLLNCADPCVQRSEYYWLAAAPAKEGGAAHVVSLQTYKGHACMFGIQARGAMQACMGACR